MLRAVLVPMCHMRSHPQAPSFTVNTMPQLKGLGALLGCRRLQEAGARPEGAACNINGALDKQWEAASLAEVLAAPPSALQGLGPKSDEAMGELGIKSVQKLASWKYAAWADALLTLAEFEKPTISS
ncbi:hypothetical protein COO60DRAFT_235452 [Scenedesmus sp. NREL 46B-D3]|nr:hypothetical protein COO60DRAFT_235452 [Scenedesmus sp. NREL 46B-D3]